MQTPPYNPVHINTYGLGCARFARRYSGHRKNLLPEHNGLRLTTQSIVQKESSLYCFLFLLVLRCFTSQGAPRHTPVTTESSGVSPFRDLRIEGYCSTSPKLIAAVVRLSSLCKA